jgi:cytochrome c oxidase assembly protein subunit 11
MMAASRNRATIVLLAAVAVLMVGLVYASVPLYRLFCQVTGFGGTTQVAEVKAVPVLDRQITVRFSANTHRNMPWQFKPQQGKQALKIGQQSLAFFEAFNPTNQVVTGTATFNVTPHKAGPYFAKIECFCFTEQTLEPGQRVDMPVTYFIDPEIVKNPDLDDVTEVTLSYTFFVKMATDNKEVGRGKSASR